MSPGPHPATASLGTASGGITTDQAIHRPKRLADEKGFALSISRCRRLVTSHVKRRETVSDAEFLALAHAIAYADPTGNTAASNVDRGRQLRRPVDLTSELATIGDTHA